MRKYIAIIEGNHEGLVGSRDGTLYGAAEGFADTLRACASQSATEIALDFTIIRPHFADHHLSSDMFDHCDGVVFTGSANRWSADEVEAAPARKVMARALDTALPVFGSCYGLQLAVAVLGGENRANPQRTEFAIARDITLSAEGKRHALYQGKAAVFDARCMHRDEIARLPSGAVSLSYNDHSTHQAMAYETGGVKFWGVQYHPELQFQDIAHYIKHNDVNSFEDARYLASQLGISDNVTEICADFMRLDKEDDAALHKKYQLSEALINKQAHRIELVNFLKQL